MNSNSTSFEYHTMHMAVIYQAQGEETRHTDVLYPILTSIYSVVITLWDLKISPDWGYQTFSAKDPFNYTP